MPPRAEPGPTAGPSGTGRARCRLLVVAAACALALAACATDRGDGATAPAGPGDPDPLEFSAAELGGGRVEGSELVGADTVLWFWAPWCTSCRAEAPDVLEAAEAFEGRVEVVGVPGRGGTPEMEQFVADTGIGELRHAVDADGGIWRRFGIIGQPAFAFVDDDGTVEVFNGGLGLEALTERMAGLTTS